MKDIRLARTGIRANVLYGCATEPGSGLGLAVTITGVAGRRRPGRSGAGTHSAGPLR